MSWKHSAVVRGRKVLASGSELLGDTRRALKPVKRSSPSTRAMIVRLYRIPAVRFMPWGGRRWDVSRANHESATAVNKRNANHAVYSARAS